MKRVLLGFALLLCLTGLMSPLAADICVTDDVPAATLLLPYFEVDLHQPAGRTTLFSVGNAGALPALAHVVLWTDLAVPTLAFDVYLTGYDLQSFNLRDLLAGNLPQTADAPRDPADTISPQGTFSADAAFPGCAGALPPPPLPADLREQLRRAHQGLSLPLTANRCAGRALGDGVARGYVTVDVVRRCSSLTPADAGYFGPDGVAADDNVLWGDFYYVDPLQDAAQGENLVRIESFPGRFQAGSRTFYARYVQGSGSDGREPLPTNWSVRTITGGGFTGGTDVIAWRDPGVAGGTVPCGTQPSWYRLYQEAFLFDEEENVETPDQFPVCCVPATFFPFPSAAGRARVAGTGAADLLPTPFPFGWAFLRFTEASAAPPMTAQAWVGSVVSASGIYGVGYAATHWDNGCEPNGTPLDLRSFRAPGKGRGKR